MNAVPFSSPDHNMDDNGPGSDTDSNPDEPAEYYQPISAVDDASSESDSSADLPQRLPNGYCVDNGVSSLSVNDSFELKSSEEDEADDDEEEVAEEEEEERAREAYDAAMRRAFRDDETRRNAPLTPHAATRVMEAMRGVSFGGLAPDWAQSVPEDQWIERLQRLRQPPHASD
ncbi:uncharacterized protein LOC115683906 [Syzygium oleosum]|uniref:uncharacterized protein LOC115683906 n=1 Tax=Syzygium oleosum TaxID=219896 RepID=UPI0011D1F956|nr:uncharacterized protein LOC115683906 [Syzygium oleosum]